MDAVKKRKGILLLKIFAVIFIIHLLALLVFKSDKYVLISVVFISSTIISIFVVYLPSENYWTNISIVGGFCFTMTGWFFSNYFNNQAAIFQNNLANENSIKNAQREMRIKYLLDSYLKITSVANRDHEPFINTFLYYKNIEQAICTASLFGDSTLVEKINKYANAHPKDANILPVVYELRNQLRNELGLDKFYNGINTVDSSYDITFYRRWILDTMLKTNPEYYNNLQIEFAKEDINRNLSK